MSLNFFLSKSISSPYSLLNISCDLRAGVVFGDVTDHVEISIAAGDCSSFLMLLLAGGANGLLEQERALESEDADPSPTSENPHSYLNKIWKLLTKSLSKIHQVDTSSSYSLLSTDSGGSFFDGGEECSSKKNVAATNVTLQGSNLEMTSSTPSNDRSVHLTGFNSIKSSSRHYDVKTNNNDSNYNEKMDKNKNNENKYSTSSCDVSKNNCNKESQSNNKKPFHSSSHLSAALSTELSLAILKNVINVIIASNVEQNQKNQNYQKRNKNRKKSISGNTDFKISDVKEKSSVSHKSKENHTSFKLNPLAPTSKLCSSVQQKMIPFRPTSLWGHFLNISEYVENLSTKSKSVESTIRILRKLMQNGSAGTIREILRILKDSFGHRCGNISLTLPRSGGEEKKVEMVFLDLQSSLFFASIIDTIMFILLYPQLFSHYP